MKSIQMEAISLRFDINEVRSYALYALIRNYNNEDRTSHLLIKLDNDKIFD